MRIAICVKQVPAASDVQIDRQTKRLRRDKAPAVMNECDRYALELALRLREENGAPITAFSMGPPQAARVLKECLALGAERACLLCDAAFAGSDTYATAHILAKAIRRDEELNGKFDLILCGKQSSDGDTAQVGAELAEQLGAAQLTGVCGKPELQGDSVCALTDGGDALLRMRARLPALLTVGSTPYALRYATISGVMAANRAKCVETLGLADLPEVRAEVIGLDGSPTRTVETYVPPRQSKAEFIEGGSVYEKASELAKRLLRGLM